MMIKLGNFLFRNRNGLFPFFYLMLFVPSPELFADPSVGLITGFTIAIAGQLIRVLTIGLVYIERGGRNRRIYAENLVTSGIFSHCRNPLYVGNILILGGLGIASNSVLFMLIFFPLFIFFYQAIVLAEEFFLKNKFGREYTDYCSRVNRWLPDLRGIYTTLQSMTFKWKRVVIREYNSTYIWVTGAVLILLKQYYLHSNRDGFNQDMLAFGLSLFALLLLYLAARYLKKSGILVSD